MDLDWNDLKFFLHVARLGGLSQAAETTGLSAATLGRRVTALEHEIGRALFHRSQTGYRLTRAGEDLLAHAEEVEAADALAGQLARGRARAPHRPGFGGHLDDGVSGGPHRRVVAGGGSLLHRVRHRLSRRSISAAAMPTSASAATGRPKRGSPEKRSAKSRMQSIPAVSSSTASPPASSSASQAKAPTSARRAG